MCVCMCVCETKHSYITVDTLDPLSYPRCTCHAVCIHQSKPMLVAVLKPSCVPHPLGTIFVHLHGCIHQQGLDIPPTEAWSGLMVCVCVCGGGRGGGKRGKGEERVFGGGGGELTSAAKCYLEMSQAYLTCSMRAIMPEAMGAAAEVPEKNCVQPL